MTAIVFQMIAWAIAVALLIDVKLLCFKQGSKYLFPDEQMVVNRRSGIFYIINQQIPFKQCVLTVCVRKTNCSAYILVISPSVLKIVR